MKRRLIQRKKSTSEKCNTADTTPLRLINNGEQTSTSALALGYPLFGPSRHVRACYCMPHCSLGSLCRDPFRHEEFRPLYHSFVPFFSILSCDPPLVGLDTESSEVVQETPHPLLFLPSRGTAPLRVLRTSRTSAVSCPPCAPQTPRTESASCAMSPRCSRSPFSRGCRGRKSGDQCDYAFAIRCSGSRGCGAHGAARRSGTSVDSM